MSDFTRLELIKLLVDNQIYNNGKGINLDGLNLSDLDLKGISFSGFSLRNCQAQNSDFSFADFSNSDLSNSTLNNSIFHYANFENAIINDHNSKFNKANFKNAKIRISPSSEFSGCYFSGENILFTSHQKIIIQFLVLENINSNLQLYNESEIKDTKLRNSTFNEPRLFGKQVLLTGNEIEKCTFDLCVNEEVVFDNNELLNCNFKANDFENCSFNEILFWENSLESCRFKYCSFKNIKFSSSDGKNLEEISFLNRVTFENCEFEDLTFSSTYFLHTQFIGCNFKNVKFDGCFIGRDDIENTISPFFNNLELEGIEEENIVLTFEYINTDGEKAKTYEKFFKFNFKI